MNFSKMHGLGNDFVIIDAVTQNVFLSTETIKKLADRNTGIGFDQLLLVEPPYSPESDFHYRIFNADGTEVEQCGNGARCFAKYVKLKGLTKKNKLNVSTAKGNIVLTINNNDTVTVNMGEPNFTPSEIPFKAQKEENTYIIRVNDQTVFCSVVSMGNPHCVIQVEDFKNAPVQELGSILATHERFPKHANIGFMQIIDRSNINLRVYERGVGETKACGTGACAAVATGIIQNNLNEKVVVNLLGGILVIEWKGKGYPLYMTGTANHVYDGFINI